MMVCDDLFPSSVTFMYPKYQEIGRMDFSVKSISLRPWDYSQTNLDQSVRLSEIWCGITQRC